MQNIATQLVTVSFPQYSDSLVLITEGTNEPPLFCGTQARTRVYIVQMRAHRGYGLLINSKHGIGGCRQAVQLHTLFMVQAAAAESLLMVHMFLGCKSSLL